MTRPSFDDVAFSILESVAQRSTCPRLHTASLIATKDNRILATGYNGSLPGQEHCDDNITCQHCEGKTYYNREEAWKGCGYCESTGKVPRGCLVIDDHCIRTVHAEMNAITQAAKYGIPILGCKMYCLHQPCLICTKLAISSGIDTFMIDGYYGKLSELKPVHEFMLNANVTAIYRKPYTG